jgi:CheY-like chemotaxis protein
MAFPALARWMHVCSPDGPAKMILHHLVAKHHDELLRRSRAKRGGSPAAELDHWLPILLELLGGVLESEEECDAQTAPGQAASLERALATLQYPMRKLGITLERVSQDCVELQQAIIELALENHATLSARQYHALDRSVARVVAGALATWESLRARVVVVETDRQVRRIVQQFVGDTYLLEFHDDGSSALDRVRSEVPSLVITEILVPRLDGLTLCRSLKTDPATAHVPILVYSMLAAEERARQSGADAFLEKPLEKRRLVARLRELTCRAPAPQPQDAAAE